MLLIEIEWKYQFVTFILYGCLVIYHVAFKEFYNEFVQCPKQS